jgi:hypothetical protein
LGKGIAPSNGTDRPFVCVNLAKSSAASSGGGPVPVLLLLFVVVVVVVVVVVSLKFRKLLVKDKVES